MSVFRDLTVEQNIAIALEARGAEKPDDSSGTEQLLKEFQLTALRDQRASTLSGGERRRCEVARALASDPVVMMMDEPLRGMDPMSIADIRRMIAQLKVRDVGVLVSDGNLHDLSDLLDRAYVISNGQLIFSGTVEELLRNERVRHLYLGEGFSL